MDEQKFEQHIDGGLLMTTETGNGAHPMVDNTPSDNGREVWRRLVQRFDPASLQANLSSMSKMLRPPEGKIEIYNISLFIGEWEGMVCRQDERVG